MERLLAWGSAGVVALSVAAGLIVLGAPQDERDRRFDLRRVGDLQRLVRVLRAAHRRDGQLPASIAPLVDGLSLDRLPEDPRTGQPYEYRILGDGRFELCAVFDAPSEASDAGFWAHDAGRRCFAFDATGGPVELVPGTAFPVRPGIDGSSPVPRG